MMVTRSASTSTRVTRNLGSAEQRDLLPGGANVGVVVVGDLAGHVEVHRGATGRVVGWARRAGRAWFGSPRSCERDPRRGAWRRRRPVAAPGRRRRSTPGWWRLSNTNGISSAWHAPRRPPKTRGGEVELVVERAARLMVGLGLGQLHTRDAEHAVGHDRRPQLVMRPFRRAACDRCRGTNAGRRRRGRGGERSASSSSDWLRPSAANRFHSSRLVPVSNATEADNPSATASIGGCG